MPGNENTKSGILQGLFICRTLELNPRQLLSRQFMSNRYLKEQDAMVELDYFSDQKHLTAMNSMTVGSMI